MIEKPEEDELQGAVQAADSSALEFKDGEFARFAELSVGLQQMIWRAVIHDPIIIDISRRGPESTIQSLILLATKKKSPSFTTLPFLEVGCYSRKVGEEILPKIPRKTRYV